MEDKKVALPKYVVDVLDKIIVSDYKPYGLLEQYEFLTSDDLMSRARLWFGNTDNQWKLLQVLEHGYEVEKEQLYYVHFSELSTYDNPTSFLNLNDGELFIGSKENIDIYKTQFTMDEIKSLGEKYVPFAVKVEEVAREDFC